MLRGFNNGVYGLTQDVKRVGFAIRHKKHELYYSIEGIRVMCGPFYDKEHLLTIEQAKDLYNKLSTNERDIIIVELDYDKGTVSEYVWGGSK